MSGSKLKPRVDLDATKGALEQLGLAHAAEELPRLLNEAVKDNVPAHRFLDRLLAAEHTRREERRIKTSLRLSPHNHLHDTYAWGPPTSPAPFRTGHARPSPAREPSAVPTSSRRGSAFAHAAL